MYGEGCDIEDDLEVGMLPDLPIPKSIRALPSMVLYTEPPLHCTMALLLSGGKCLVALVGKMIPMAVI